LILAALIIAVTYTGLGEQIGAETLVQYVSSFPVFIAATVWPTMPDLFLVTLFVLYYAVLGVFAGWVLGKGTSWKIGAFVVVIVLVFAHVKTKILLE
jgi:hypothetical protein